MNLIQVQQSVNKFDLQFVVYADIIDIDKKFGRQLYP